MSRENLKIVTPEKITPENVCAYIKDAANESSKQCEEAKIFWEFLQHQHNSIAKLMERAEELRSKPETIDTLEELKSTLEATVEIYESLRRVQGGGSFASESTPIDETGDQHELEEMLENDKTESTFISKFLEAYNRHKSRLGLKTQEEVSELTGIDRRYISNIERAKYRPQYKTIKRLAAAFGADVQEFM